VRQRSAFYGADLAWIHRSGYEPDARAWLSLLRRAGVRRGLVVDLGCGAGGWASALVRRGYGVWGVDRSRAMIAMARRRVPRGAFVRASIVEARLPACDAVTAIGEILNYLGGPAEVRRVFRSVRAALRPGGAFVFDVLLPQRDVRVNARVERDWATISRNEDDGRRLVRDITWFRREGRVWRRGREVHRQRLYRASELAAWLRREGLAVRVTAGPWPRHALLAAILPSR